MRCSQCGRDVPDEVRYCPVCGNPVGLGVVTAPATKAKGVPDWQIGVAVIAVVAIVLIPVLVYSMPWSKMKVIISHSEYSQIGVDVYIDGVLKASIEINPGTTTVGVWNVDVGTHTVQVDKGEWYFYDGLFFDYWSYEGPDGYADYTYAYGVGPLFTKNVYITL